MSNLQIFVIHSGFVMTILIVWHFRFAPKAKIRFVITEAGVQEVASGGKACARMAQLIS
jgi:hypothetical protein